MRLRIKSRQSVGPWREAAPPPPPSPLLLGRLVKIYYSPFFSPPSFSFFADLPCNYTLISDSEGKGWVGEETRKERWRRRKRNFVLCDFTFTLTVFVFRLLPDLQIGRSSQFDVHDWSTDDTEHFCRSLNVLRERHENYIKTSFLYLHFDFSSRNQVHHFTFFPTSDIFDAFLFKFSGKKKQVIVFFWDVFVKWAHKIYLCYLFRWVALIPNVADNVLTQRSLSVWGYL